MLLPPPPPKHVDASDTLTAETVAGEGVFFKVNADGDQDSRTFVPRHVKLFKERMCFITKLKMRYGICCHLPTTRHPDAAGEL